MKYYETSVATDVYFKNKTNFCLTEPQKLNFINQIRLYCKNTSTDMCLQSLALDQNIESSEGKMKNLAFYPSLQQN